MDNLFLVSWGSVWKSGFSSLVKINTILALLVLFPLILPGFSELRAEVKRNQIELKSKSNAVVRNIYIRVEDIFESNKDNKVFRAINNLKANTREGVVLRDLLLKEGDPYDDFLVAESERVLRQVSYLRQVSITPRFEGDKVDLYVSVQDTWTLFPQFVYSTGGGTERRSVALVENNLLGYGKRFEVLWADDEGRETIEFVWDDRRLFGSHHNLVLGHFERSDGRRSLFNIGRPFRSLVEESSWQVQGDFFDLVGRLFEGGDESFIYRQRHSEFASGYTRSVGDPERLIKRYTLGYAFSKDSFSEADEGDFQDVDLDPLEVSSDPELLALDREFSGPFLSYSLIEPDFISTDYVDRFERVEDFNLGVQFSSRLQFASEALGSEFDTLLGFTRVAKGWRLTKDSFLRSEFSSSSRLHSSGFDNTVLDLGVRYYNVIGAVSYKDFYLGKHTIASALKIRYSEDLDKDRQFLLGASGGLRGYENRTFFGDKSFVLSIEDRVSFSENVFQLVNFGGAFFFDVGGVGDGTTAEIFQDQVYADFGVGLRVGFPRSSGGSVLRIDLAFPLRDGPDGSDQFEPRLLITSGQAFGARLRHEKSNVVQTESVLGPD